VSSKHADVVVVGAGIVGLAHAWTAARLGKKVVVLERRLAAAGASVANFGLLWPIGQPAGRMFELAMRSRALWLEVLEAAAIPHKPTGSLHVACREDEVQTGQEFAELAPALGYRCSWLNREEALASSPVLNPRTVMGALRSETEISVDPREVLRLLPRFLADRYDIEFRWGCSVLEVRYPQVHTTEGTWTAEKVIVCTGADFDNLYPELLLQSGMTCCRLQMLRTPPQPHGWELGPALAGGLTFRFYPSFEICTSLPELRERIARETPEYDRYGIHTMISQASSGELTLGDSHEYGVPVSPFSREEIDQLILRHIETYARIPNFSVAERWHGVYSRHRSRPFVRLQPEPGVDVVTGLGGAGMTLSFAVAAETFENPAIDRSADHQQFSERDR
jgi:D-hydroxyproline dehydrogenase subunit beta